MKIKFLRKILTLFLTLCVLGLFSGCQGIRDLMDVVSVLQGVSENENPGSRPTDPVNDSDISSTEEENNEQADSVVAGVITPDGQAGDYRYIMGEDGTVTIIDAEGNTFQGAIFNEGDSFQYITDENGFFVIIPSDDEN